MGKCRYYFTEFFIKIIPGNNFSAYTPNENFAGILKPILMARNLKAAFIKLHKFYKFLPLIFC